ncbi:bifunctional 4-hydroxy-3-methylbut-2-enyl diphosphate reductase/30S ribosomal protein S1 [Ruminococcus sp. LCP21S3_E8]|nr:MULTISPECIES: bifunctional 4-hydroxy-3-methylbut-2-enyl diphosphate reductase/30S ribosomal protein S1 [Ruminococcus]MCI5598483.1 bifunctional 4-hydroxy-3-methylbut-2-enyl diphosphate reductase/30S ribosomal protein S1 [Ruminococcus sp.]MCI5618275.1 bifunctional 4-hydroxy-3-methylbut-2-enyl diphosphate reductase/30S ribosomal protein S1 [Ruminococcus sp.]MCI6505480.1 bifunctional 4-hydroxy-3-methylbut-2-enyl diphosphate reductase/30S ribosomal protein S1 [Ruminococcus sp.]MDD6531717.1 bifunc
MSKIIVAESAGFCFGVNRAINILYKLIDEKKPACTLGPIIHNMQMVNELREKGVRTIDKISEAKENETIVIRSHGVPQSIVDEINERHLDYIDATCPFVSKIHKIVSETDDDSIVIIAGDKNHPEVQGIMGHCKSKCYTFKNQEELQELFSIIPQKNYKTIKIVAQTTFDLKEWEKSLKSLKNVYTNTKIFDTICNATSIRQREAANISKSVDLMFVIGDKHSSNSFKLYSICSSNCENTFFIETADELPLEMVKKADSIGVTAGASTPARIIKEVLDKMSEVNTSSVNENELSFEEMLEESLKSMNTNERVMGTVMSIAPNGDVSVDVGRKQAGFIPKDEISYDPTVTAQDVLKVGDEVELLIMKTNDQEGTIMLSKKRVDAQKNWEELEALNGSDEIFTGKVIEAVNGGIIVMLKDNRIFIPASQATLSRDEDPSALVGKEVQYRLLEVSRKGRRKRAIGSIKSVLKEKRAEEKAKLLETLAVGNHYKGVVKSLTSYGAFVDIGGVYGMIHISELSWSRIKHPSEVVNVGDEVEVYIKDINEETKKISLGYKKEEDNPWFILKNEYPVGSVVKCKIVGLTTFGAFANIIPGIDGLIHISQIANKRIDKPQDVLSVGQEVEAKIIAIDFDKKRVSLSMRALLPEEADKAEDTAEVAE